MLTAYSSAPPQGDACEATLALSLITPMLVLRLRVRSGPGDFRPRAKNTPSHAIHDTSTTAAAMFAKASIQVSGK